MSKSTTILVVVGVVAVGLIVGWLGTSGSRTNTPAPTEPMPAPGGSNSVAMEPNRSGMFAPRKSNPAQVGTAPNAGGNSAVASADAQGANLITNWEEKVDQILTSEGLDTDKAKQMLEMFPRLSEEGQVEVAQHISNLLPDDEYAALGKFLVDPKLPEDVQDELMADILNRANSVKLPYLLEVAKEPDHSKASEAKDLLELFLEEDYGTDWSKWQSKLDEWLKENPD